MSTDSGERPRQETCSQDSARTKDQSPRSDVIEVEQKEVAGWDTLKKEVAGWDTLKKKVGGWDTLKKEVAGWDTLKKEVAGWDTLKKEVAGWDALKTFCETTTFHGLRNITEPNDNGARR